ncbi:MAG: molybdenum cofactor guanylyltransferase [Flavobacteriaceae bacterium]
MDIGNNRTGIILAGGKSSRMQTDKGLLPLGDDTFVSHILKAMQPFVNEVLIVTSNLQYDAFGHKRVEDHFRGLGPVSGLYTGLYHSQTEENLVVSCDVPFITPQVFSYLFEHAEKTAAVNLLESSGNTMPLIALYQKRCLPFCLEQINKRELAMHQLISKLESHIIPLEEALALYVRNINTREEFEKIQHEIAH